MISSVRGSVLHVESESVVVEVGGVGLAVAVTPQVARTTHVGDAITLHTSLIVREDALSLFGFADRDQLRVFSLLLGVTGVGPKSALGVLAALTVDQIAEAITGEDDAPFRRVSGIGPKTAKLITLQLQGKIEPQRGAAPSTGDPTGDVSAQVVAALSGLGWTERVAAEAVAAVIEGAPIAEHGSVPALLRRTLAVLGPSRKETVGG